jgi:hypothetical protein
MQVEPMKLRLFAIRDTQTNKIVLDDFSDKKAAKAERDRLGGAPRYVVTPGPDHRKNKR